jgi:hypothetical protein
VRPINKSFILIFCLMLNMATPVAALVPLVFQKKTLMLSGSLTPIYRLADFWDMRHEVLLKSQIGMGYFFTDHLSLGLSLPADLNILPSLGGEAGLALSATYLFSSKIKAYPYIGLQVSPRYSIATQMVKLVGGANVGVLLGLSPDIALDLGLAPEIEIPLNSKQKWHLEAPAGFIGIRAFF